MRPRPVWSTSRIFVALYCMIYINIFFDNFSYVLDLWWKLCYKYKAFIFIWLFYSVITHPFVELKIKEYVTICMLWWSTKEDERIGIEWTFIKSSILIESLIDAFCDKRPAHHFACKEMKAFGSNLMIRLSIRLLVVIHIMVLFYFI